MGVSPEELLRTQGLRAEGRLQECSWRLTLVSAFTLCEVCSVGVSNAERRPHSHMDLSAQTSDGRTVKELNRSVCKIGQLYPLAKS